MTLTLSRTAVVALFRNICRAAIVRRRVCLVYIIFLPPRSLMSSKIVLTATFYWSFTPTLQSNTTDAARCAGVVGCTGSQAKLHFLYLLLLHYSYSSRVTLYDLLEILGGNRLTSPSIISPASPTIAVQASLTSRARRKGWQLFVSVYIVYILHI